MKVEANDILEYSIEMYGTKVDTRPWCVNLFALEGGNVDLTPNDDRPDAWNDSSVIITHDNNGVPQFAHIGEATCEPGLSATFSKQAERLGGVARIAIGFHEEKWIRGFHKQNRNHPALVQCAPITCHRDRNKDGKRTGDPVTVDVQGLNWHGTRANLKPVRVGEWSYACNVRRNWSGAGSHMEFMALCDADPRYMLNKQFRYSGTVVDYSRFWKWFERKQMSEA